MTSTTKSPLLQGHGLPEYASITPDRVRQDIPVLLKNLEDEFSTLESELNTLISKGSPLRWSNVMTPLQSIGERLRWSWGVVSHLNGVCNSPELREAHASQQADVVRLGNRLGQSRTLYEALQHLR